MRRKKASLSLSINAIVILVLAITMLGLGLAFTKGMFGKLSSKLSVPEPDIPATADDRIVLPTEELTITKNKQFVFSVNVYNDNFQDAVTGELLCPAGTTDTGVAVPAIGGANFGELKDVTSGPLEIAPGEDNGFKFIIPKRLVGQSLTRICRLEFQDSAGYSEIKQVVVTIK